MAGHSKFKNIMHRKGKQDAIRAKKFTRLLREIQVASKAGLPDPVHNPSLRSAITTAKAANVPNDNIDRAIKKGQGADSENYEDVRYEGYGPGGVALIVEAMTDNRNRTASEVRAAFAKYAGNLGETNSVSFQFDRIGIIRFPITVADEETMLEAAIEAGAEDCEADEDGHQVVCAPDDLATVRDSLEARFGSPEEAYLGWRPQVSVPVDDDKAPTLLKLLEVLDENDDVQRVTGNYEVSEEALANY